MIAPQNKPELWAHQQREVDKHTWDAARFMLWDPRTGKTRPIVHEIAAWIAQDNIRRVLVVAPKTGCSVWLQNDELGRFDPRFVRVVDCSPYSELDSKERAVLIAGLDKDFPTVIVVNRDTLFGQRDVLRKDKVISFAGLLGPLCKWKPQALILDESHDYKTISSVRSRAVALLAKSTKYRRALTGTVDPNSYVDLYSQFKIIAPQVFGTRKKDFVDRYVIAHPLWPNKVEGYRNVDELRAKMFSVSSVVRQKDCFDMPAVRDVTIPIALPRTVRELYREITANAVADFFGVEVDATHQFARLTVLHRLAAGMLKREDGSIEWIHDEKIRTVLEQIEQLQNQRVVVFYHYRAEGERLYSELLRRYDAARVWSLHGGTKPGDRVAAPFRQWPKLQVFLAQEDTGNLAISLREADHVLWTSWGTKADVHYQARQRIFDESINKPQGLTYGYLEAAGTVDVTHRMLYRQKRSASDILRTQGFAHFAQGVDV